MIFSELRLCGTDAADFAHRITTVNVRKLSAGQGARGLLLEASSKLIASFTLVHPQNQEYLFLGSTEEITELAREFNHLHFSENIEMAQRTLSVSVQETSALDLSAEFFPFTTGSWPWAYADNALAKEAEGSFDVARWESIRIQQKYPLGGKEFMPRTHFALDLGLTAWIHQDKGCYPGQEVVEKSLRVGHPGKALILVKGSEDLEVGDEVYREERLLAKLTSVSGPIGLVMVPWVMREPGGRFIIRRHGSLLGEVVCHK